jgi:carboxymethylenebutenolidase
MPDTFKSHGLDIPVEVFPGAGPGPRPAVVVVYGTRGMNAPFGDLIRGFAKKLAASGCTAFIPDYLKGTGTPASTGGEGDIVVMAAVQPSRDQWVATIGDALAYAAARSDVRADRLGLLGFSLGGHVTLRAAKRASGNAVKAAVSFFAPIAMAPFGGIGGDIDKLPPLQIHHGEDDGPPVPPAESQALEGLLLAAGKLKGRDYELFFYEGQGHGFTGQAAVASEKRTVDFFATKLA